MTNEEPDLTKSRLAALALVRATIAEDIPLLRLVGREAGADQLSIDLAALAASLLNEGCEDVGHALAVVDGWTIRVLEESS